jgi:hypothetical protein
MLGFACTSTLMKGHGLFQPSAGWGTYGQLGDGKQTYQQTRPVRVADKGPWNSISAGDVYTLGVKNDQTGWSW